MIRANRLTAKLTALVMTLGATTFGHGGCSDDFFYVVEEVGFVADALRFGPPIFYDDYYYYEEYHEDYYDDYDDGFGFDFFFD